MILYFTGTGNSRYAALSLSNLLEDADVVDAGAKIKAGESGEYDSQKPFVFVSPTYAWRIPHVFEEWIRKCRFTGSDRAYFVMTCGDSIGDAGAYLHRLCGSMGLKYAGVTPVIMPENYVAMFGTPDAETAGRITREAGEKYLPAIAETICGGGMLKAPPAKIRGFMESHFTNPIFYQTCVSAKGFRVTQKCIGCGKCAALCPLNNVSLREDRPVWNNRCTHCMACICGCPVEAIEYGQKSVGKPRVWNATPPCTKEN